MKEWNDQSLKFLLDDENLTMTISIEELKRLFNTHPYNFNGDGQYAFIKDGKDQEFVEAIVERLRNDHKYDNDNLNWSKPLSDAFDDMLEYGECDNFLRLIERAD